jgi:hypothetical protein
MKSINIAIVKANNDPLGLGRIRYNAYSTSPGPVEGAFKDYENWDDKDPFIATPFLPQSINHVPEIGQSVKILTYDSEKELVNVEYIAGPFTTSHDFNSQTFTDSLRHTTYGNSGKKGPDVFNLNGTYKEKKSYGAFAKPEDHGLYGMYGSDLIFTDSGINLRGGKLPTKEFANAENRKKLLGQPIMSDNLAALHLKKFPKKLNLVDDVTEEKKFETGKLKYMIEYDINNIESISTGGTSNIYFYIYDTTNDNDLFVIQNDKLQDAQLTTGSTMLNIFSDFNENPNVRTYSFVVSVKGYKEAYITVRNIIKGFNTYGFKHFNVYDKDDNVHPFFFRPTREFAVRTLSTTPIISGGTSPSDIRETIFDNIDPMGRIKNGIIYSKISADIPFKTDVKKEKVIKVDEQNREQSFASLKGDKIYLMSTDTNEIKPINFKKLDKYEHTHENYIEDIEPNTYALVRGEILVDILKCMSDLLESHQHQPTEPLVKSDPNFIRLQKQINTLENDLLNTSIRIN